MDKPVHTKTAVLPWGSFYLMCSFISFLVLMLIGLSEWQKTNPEGFIEIALAVGVLLQGLMVFSITRTLDATNRMCAYLVELAKGADQKQASGSYKEPWSCPICKQQNNYWDENCVKCGHRR
jgi:hypothetical protein